MDVARRIFAALLIAACAAFPVAAPASASTVDANYGALQSNVDPAVHAILAPGQTGTGPLRIVKGVVAYPNMAFNGGIGYFKVVPAANPTAAP